MDTNTAVLNYTPPPTVRQFITHYRPGELFFDWIIGPVGSGKTTGDFFKLVYMAQLQEPSPVDGVRRTRCVIVRNTFPQLRDTTIPSWNYWFKDGQAGVWKATANTFVLRFGMADGTQAECEVLFRALDTPDDVNRVLSLEVTFAILDEFVLIDKNIVEALSARCGRYPSAVDGGATNWGMWGASNPGNEDNWWYEALGLDPNGPALASNHMLFQQPSGFAANAENLENLPGKAAYYTNLVTGKSEAWVRQFIEVQWGFSVDGKPVFPQFQRQLHVAQRPLMPNPRLELVIGFDPGIRNSAMIIGQEDLHGRLLVYDEIIMQDVGAERAVQDFLRPLLRAKYPDFPMDNIVIAADPAANSRAASNESSIVRDIRKMGFDVDFDPDNTLAPRLQAGEHYLTRLTPAGPALQVDAGCKGLLRALGGGYKYLVNRRGDKTSQEPDKNDHSHPADAFMYLAKYCLHGAKRGARRAKRTPRRVTPYVNNYTH